MNKAINNTLVAAIFLVPLSSLIPIHGTIVWYPQLLCLMAIALVALSLNLWEFCWPISLLLIYLVFSYLFVTEQNPRTMICLVCGLGGMYLSYFVSKSELRWPYYICLAFMAAIQCFYVVLQAFNFDPFFHALNSTKADVVGLLGSHNQVGLYYAALSPILASISIWLLPIALIPIWLAKSTTGALAAILAVFTFLGLTYRIKTLVILVFGMWLLFGPWLYFNHKTHAEWKERTGIWALTLDQIIHGRMICKLDNGQTRVITTNPLFGFGLGSFFMYSPSSQFVLHDAYNKTIYEHAHNDLIEVFFELGFVGLILVLLCAARIIYDFKRLGRDRTTGVIIAFTSLMAMAICSMCIYVFHAPVSLFMFCLILGLFYAEVDHAYKSKGSKITTEAASGCEEVRRDDGRRNIRTGQFHPVSAGYVSL